MSERVLLDTDVVSELARSAPAPAVLTFIARLDEIFLSSVGLFELARGVQRLPPGRKKKALERWLAEWLATPVTVLPFDAAAARAAATIETTARRAGRGIDVRDLFVLSIARSNHLVVATHNVSHFRGHGVQVLDPFSS